MRYFAELAYKGTKYSGWQIQPNAISVQQLIEEALSTILNTSIQVMGCGRTDAGVHASQFFLHFDFTEELPKSLVNRLNKFLPSDIVIYKIFPVHTDAHTRFDAHLRSYVYLMDLTPNPFDYENVWYYYNAKSLDIGKMNEVTKLLLQYEEFAPFCKTNSDAKTMRCELSRAEWILDTTKNRLEFHISANRFLRGMVRLIVGACVYVGENKISLEDVRKAMDKQTPLKKSYSVPGHGLYLCEVKYSYID